MRPLILAAAASLMLLFAGRAAAADMEDEPEGCDGTTGQMLECNIEHSRRADLELERYLAAVRRKLADDAAENADDWPDTKETLPRFEAAQAAWSAYRENECEAVRASTLGGGFRDVMYQICWANMTRDRTTSIWSTWLANLEGVTPALPDPNQ